MGFEVYNLHQLVTNWDQLTASNGTNGYNLYSGSGYPASLQSLFVSNSDTIDHEIVFALDADGAAPIGTLLVPAGAGHSSSVPSIDAIPALVGAGRDLRLEGSASLYVLALVAITGSYNVGFAWLSGRF